MDDETPFGMSRLSDLLAYRKVTIAVVAAYLGLEDAFVTAVLQDQMDEYLQAQAGEQERMKEEQYDVYLTRLSQEIIVRYAATAAETLVADADTPMAQAHRVMGDTGGLGLTDDVNAVVRVHEIFEYLESPDASEEAEKILQGTKRYLCHYYNAVAFALVKGPLLPVIIQTAEEFYRQGNVSAARLQELIISEQNIVRTHHGTRLSSEPPTSGREGE